MDNIYKTRIEKYLNNNNLEIIVLRTLEEKEYIATLPEEYLDNLCDRNSDGLTDIIRMIATDEDEADTLYIFIIRNKQSYNILSILCCKLHEIELQVFIDVGCSRSDNKVKYLSYIIRIYIFLYFTIEQDIHIENIYGNMTGNVVKLTEYHVSRNCTVHDKGYMCLRDDYFTKFRTWFDIVYKRNKKKMKISIENKRNKMKNKKLKSKKK